MYLSITSRYLGPVFQCSCIPISSSKYKKDTFSLYVVMHFPFQLRSITSSCPSGAFFRYSHFWLLYGFRIGSDRWAAGDVAYSEACETSKRCADGTYVLVRESVVTQLASTLSAIWIRLRVDQKSHGSMTNSNLPRNRKIQTLGTIKFP